MAEGNRGTGAIDAGTSGVTRLSPGFSPPDSIATRPERLRSARARLSPRQRADVDADPALSRLFTMLDLLGPIGAYQSALAAQRAGMSRTTLWRRCIKVLQDTYSRFVRRWRVDLCDWLFERGMSSLRIETAAELSGLRTAARARAAFVACRGYLPTGRQSRARTSSRRLPLFASVP